MKRSWSLLLWFAFASAGLAQTSTRQNPELLVDDTPVALAADRKATVFDTDHEFDGGSRINVTDLSNVQIKNLATLAKVWGFLKYHHPAVTGGLYHWDYELFRILPRVPNAADSAAANAAIASWIAGFGSTEDCAYCASLYSGDLHLSPDLDWIADELLLGSDLSRTLQTVHRNRRSAEEQFYVSLVPGIGNPAFENELAYESLKLLDSGYQPLSVLALRLTVNQRNEALLTSTPIADLTQPPGGLPL